MALGIEGATIGVDTGGIQTLLNDINAQVIEGATTQMRNGAEELNNAVNAAWVGTSADMFKQNMESDRELIITRLSEMYEALETELSRIATEIKTRDEEIVSARGGAQ